MSMTSQQIFDKVLHHLRSQGMAAASPGGACWLLHRETGRSCAVGCFLEPEDAIRIDRGSTMVYDIRRDEPEVYAKLDPNDEHIGLLDELQIAHDARMPKEEGYHLDDWEAEMRSIAQRYKLVYTLP